MIKKIIKFLGPNKKVDVRELFYRGTLLGLIFSTFIISLTLTGYLFFNESGLLVGGLIGMIIIFYFSLRWAQFFKKEKLYCPNCGKKLSKDKCPKCGFTVTEELRKKIEKNKK
ncbi:MAG: Archaeal DNA polymerase II large subunit [Candidatus Methanohalarchaeum thermophilum]|uniref:Archaeal DNA polymerase II large subunit n=1 Tax=Methanohalarchaeum thermophilum TaxID=1903181 RepID=A0A1Q6DUX6_METT1|nr:MAG: Archaeal DNA polymerase II large subunit [Candidatus Methanohalarchaeum thermophilum]